MGEAMKKELMRNTRASTEAKKVQESMNSSNDDEFACMMQPKTSKAPNPDAVYTDKDMVDSEVRRWLNFDAYQESEILKDCEQTNPIELLKCFNPLDFWETKKLQFPLLYRMACRYLPAPCAESFAERMFSSGGKLAGNCSTETVERRIQMRINSRFLEKHIGLIKKVHTPRGWEYLLNLDRLRSAIEEDGTEETESDGNIEEIED